MTLDAVVHVQAHQWYGISAAPRQPEDNCLAECVDLDTQPFTQKITGGDLTGFFQAWFRGGAVPADKYLWPGTLKP